MPDEKKLRVAIYCRLARADDDCGNGMEAQRQLVRDYAIQHGFTVYDEYIDNGASGITLERPALARLNEDIRARRVQAVLIKDVARLFRDHFLLGEWLNEMRPYGLSVISAQDGDLENMFRPFSRAAAESLPAG